MSTDIGGMNTHIPDVPIFLLDNGAWAYLANDTWYLGSGSRSLGARVKQFVGFEKSDVDIALDTMPVAAGIVCDPSTDAPLVFQDGVTWLNDYRGLRLTADEGDWSSIREVLLHICGNDEDALEYALDWLAAPLQSLSAGTGSVKNKSALIFHGVQGTGKGFTFGGDGFLSCIYGRHHVLEIGKENLKDTFDHSKMQRALLLVANELSASSHRDSQTLDQLKRMVTEPIMNIRQMQRASREVTSHFNTVFLSNHDDPIRLEESDRRYSVFHQIERLPQAIIDELVNERDNGWPSAACFLAHLLSREIDRDLSIPYANEARRRLLDSSIPMHVQFADLLRELGVSSMVNDWEAEISKRGRHTSFVHDGSYVFVPTETLMEVYLYWCRQVNIRYPVKLQLLVSTVLNANEGSARCQKVVDSRRRRGIERLPWGAYVHVSDSQQPMEFN